MPKQPMGNILLVEDDSRLGALVRDYLVQESFDVRLETRGDKAIRNFDPVWTELVILDLMLPGADGLQVCKALREDYSGPILMLTAKGGDIDQVLGLELGADDYVVKPIEPRVLLARVRALLRRIQGGHQTDEPLQFGKLEINRSAQQVKLDTRVVPLTTHEFNLLCLLARNAGRILPRDDIYQHMRGIEYDGLDRSVDVGICRLRKKLGDEGEQPQRIKTVWGRGYLFVPDAWS